MKNFEIKIEKDGSKFFLSISENGKNYHSLGFSSLDNMEKSAEKMLEFVRENNYEEVKMSSVYWFRNFYIPKRMMGGLKRYIEDHIEPGGFLSSVICNDLSGAIGQADDENLVNIPAFVAYLYNEASTGCWGSREKFEKWLKH